MDTFDVCVIGGGVIGLAVAKSLVEKFESVVVLEKENIFGSGVSSRNSEVVHAGIYYAPESLKARLCVEGKQLLYEHCKKYGVSVETVGKYIVAFDADQVEALENLQSNAIENGVVDLSFVGQEKLGRVEPEVKAALGLFSPSTGILDCHSFMRSLVSIVESSGGIVSLNTHFLSAESCDGGFIVSTNSAGESFRFKAQILVNAAGLNAQSVAQRIDGIDIEIPKLYLCKGSYFSLAGKAPFRHLIYPIPDKNIAGLGIHATLDLSGQVRFGPDTEYVAEIDFLVDEDKRAEFAQAIKRYYPLLDESQLIPAYAGIRPKLQAPGSMPRDFEIIQQAPGLINLYGIESPGLTASLAIGNYVADLLS